MGACAPRQCLHVRKANNNTVCEGCGLSAWWGAWVVIAVALTCWHTAFHCV
jgi:hypothetical protein